MSGYRYTVFIPMYPFGVVAELMLLYLALPFAKAREMYNLDMPNALNFAFDWHIFLVVSRVRYGLQYRTDYNAYTK
jgi:very-long-chain (3R)-3-hydroxyacyl-CoA dehydratase